MEYVRHHMPGNPAYRTYEIGVHQFWAQLMGSRYYVHLPDKAIMAAESANDLWPQIRAALLSKKADFRHG